MIIVTGAAGFIGSAVVWQLSRSGEKSLIACDRFKDGDKWRNLRDLSFDEFVYPEQLVEFMEKNVKEVQAVIHLGACSATTEKDMDFLYQNNFLFSRVLWEWCALRKKTFVYASSAATYGDGEAGYLDDEKTIPQLKPLNKYGWSKQLFDVWALKQKVAPPSWAGLKFFNVFGPNEYHKGSMASVLLHAFNQFKTEGKIRLFQSHRAGIADGEQKRDFVYIKDVVSMIDFFRRGGVANGIYNVASGEARSFLDFTKAMFGALKTEPVIEFIPTPETIRDKYQYFTQGDISKIKKAGFKGRLHTLEEAVADYVGQYLAREKSYLSIV